MTVKKTSKKLTLKKISMNRYNFKRSLRLMKLPWKQKKMQKTNEFKKKNIWSRKSRKQKKRKTNL